MSNDSDVSFLGKGWGFPPTFSRNGLDISLVSQQEDIQQSLLVLLKTAQGERIMREDFGCDLQTFMFEEISQSLINSITQLITDAVLYYEPRITLNTVNVDESEQDLGVVLITLDYTINSTNSRFNMVYPFYINEASANYA